MTSELFDAVRRRDHGLVRRLVDEGADVSERNPGYRRTALHYAAMEADGDMVAILLAAGADVDARDEHDMTPLLSTPSNRTRARAAVAAALLAAGAKPDLVSDEGWTALHYAAFEGADDVAKVLLDAGADPNVTDHAGVTPLHVAAGNHAAYERVVEALLAGGADRNAKTTGEFASWDLDHPAGLTPLEIARAHGHTGLVSLLER
jgi:ankyrin repeat protein